MPVRFVPILLLVRLRYTARDASECRKRPCISMPRSLGFRVGIAGNQPSEAALALLRVGLEFDWVLSSTSLGIAKPSLLFFERSAQFVAIPASRIAYIGDRLENDIIPASEVGLAAIRVQCLDASGGALRRSV